MLFSLACDIRARKVWHKRFIRHSFRQRENTTSTSTAVPKHPAKRSVKHHTEHTTGSNGYCLKIPRVRLVSDRGCTPDYDYRFHLAALFFVYFRLLERAPFTDVPTKRRFFAVDGAPCCPCPLCEGGASFAVALDELPMPPSTTAGSARHTLKCSCIASKSTTLILIGQKPKTEQADGCVRGSFRPGLIERFTKRKSAQQQYTHLGSPGYT